MILLKLQTFLMKIQLKIKMQNKLLAMGTMTYFFTGYFYYGHLYILNKELGLNVENKILCWRGQLFIMSPSAAIYKCR